MEAGHYPFDIIRFPSIFFWVGAGGGQVKWQVKAVERRYLSNSQLFIFTI